MMNRLNKIFSGILIMIVAQWMYGCQSSSVIVHSNEMLEQNLGVHFFQPTNYSRFKLRLKGIKTLEDKKLSFEVLFRGKNENFIGVINCYGGFQDPKYLVFFQNGKMKILLDSFDADEIYCEYLKFLNENRDEMENAEQIWPYLLNFINTELINKHSKINFP